MSPFKALLILTGAFSSVAFAKLIQTAIKPEPAIAQTRPRVTPYRTKTVPCPAVLPAETEGETVTCGVLVVPENYDQPNGRQVEISYARFYSKSLSPLPDPVFYLEGGPGGSTIGHLDAYSRLIFAPHRQTRDVVFFDQRGTQFSSQLGCAPTAFALDEMGSKFDQYVKKIADDDPLTDDLTIAKYALCAQLLQRHGFDLSQFNTPNSARDTVNLAAALGYKQINLYGISYGTYLAMAIARSHPSVVRSVVLDSTATPSVNKYTEGVRRVVTPMANLLKDCEADAACNRAYPNLQARLNALLEKLVKQPIPLPKVATSTAKDEVAAAAETSITLKSFADKVPDWLNTQPSFAAYLPLMISELGRGITTTYEQALSKKLFKADSKPESVQLVAYYRKLATDFEIKAQELLNAKATTAQRKRPSVQWVIRVQEQIKTLPKAKQDLAIANLFGVGYESGRMRDRATLMTFTTETFPAKTAQSLSAALQAMPEAEIRYIYQLLSSLINQVNDIDATSTAGMHYSFDCREQVSWFSQTDADAVYRSLPLPLLAQPSRSEMNEQVAICKHWPVKPAEPSEHQVQKISIPTLVMQGRYDAQTTTDRGIRAMAWLTSGTYVEFPSLGHGVSLTPCGKAVGMAFLDRPEIAPNTSCTQALKPKFILPPASAQ
ncbi:hypothetical protein NIES2101_36275 [Calothrix sp. HK-06]|nr:hypothetical protein NIES2101_36275 [Calothrix sp. HK-06]